VTSLVATTKPKSEENMVVDDQNNYLKQNHPFVQEESTEAGM